MTETKAELSLDSIKFMVIARGHLKFSCGFKCVVKRLVAIEVVLDYLQRGKGANESV
jgi:hypothetical protein